MSGRIFIMSPAAHTRIAAVEVVPDDDDPSITWARLVWDDRLDDYFRLGWMLSALHYEANGHRCWIMVWRGCVCGRAMREPRRS